MVFIDPLTRQRVSRARHTGDMIYDAQGDNAISQETVPVVGPYSDYTVQTIESGALNNLFNVQGSSIQQPDTSIRGIALSPNGDLVSADSVSNHIYHHSGISENITGSFEFANSGLTGLFFSGEDLYAVNFYLRYFHYSGISNNLLFSGNIRNGLSSTYSATLKEDKVYATDFSNGSIYEYPGSILQLSGNQSAISPSDSWGFKDFITDIDYQPNGSFFVIDAAGYLHFLGSNPGQRLGSQFIGSFIEGAGDDLRGIVQTGSNIWVSESSTGSIYEFSKTRGPSKLINSGTQYVNSRSQQMFAGMSNELFGQDPSISRNAKVGQLNNVGQNAQTTRRRPSKRYVDFTKNI